MKRMIVVLGILSVFPGTTRADDEAGSLFRIRVLQPMPDTWIRRVVEDRARVAKEKSPGEREELAALAKKKLDRMRGRSAPVEYCNAIIDKAIKLNEPARAKMLQGRQHAFDLQNEALESLSHELGFDKHRSFREVWAQEKARLSQVRAAYVEAERKPELAKQIKIDSDLLKTSLTALLEKNQETLTRHLQEEVREFIAIYRARAKELGKLFGVDLDLQFILRSGRMAEHASDGEFPAVLTVCSLTRAQRSGREIRMGACSSLDLEKGARAGTDQASALQNAVHHGYWPFERLGSEGDYVFEVAASGYLHPEAAKLVEPLAACLAYDVSHGAPGDLSPPSGGPADLRSPGVSGGASGQGAAVAK